MEPESATSGPSGVAEIDSPAAAAQGMASDVAAGQGVRDALGAAVGVLNDVAEQVDPGGFATIVDAAPRSPHSASAAVLEVDGAAMAVAEQPVTSVVSQAADRLLANNYVAMTDGRGQRASALDVQGLAADLIDINADEPALATSTYTAVVERIGPALGRQLDAAIHDAAQPRLEPYPGGRQFHADEIAIIQGAAPGFRDYLSRYGVDLTVPEAERVLAQSAYRTINPAGPDAEALSPEDMARFGGEGTRFLGLQMTPPADEVLHRSATDYLRGEMRARGINMPLEADPVHADAGRMFHFMPAHEAAGDVTEVYAGTLETHADFYVENNLYRDVEGGPERLAEHQRIAEFMERGTIAAPFIATGFVAVGLAPTAYAAVLANPATTTEAIIAGAEVAAGDALGASTLAPIVAPTAIVATRFGDELVELGTDALNALRRNTPEFDDAARGIGAGVWDARATTRGDLIEEHLAETDYADWTRLDDLVDAETGRPLGHYEVFDFAQENVFVSVKSVDTTSPNWVSRMMGELNTMANSTDRSVYGRDLVLDIRVQPGGIDPEAAQRLARRAEELGLQLTIREFPN